MNFSIYQLKPRFQQLLQPSLIWLSRKGITPNQVTLAAMALSIGYGTMLALLPWQGLWVALPLILLLRMALNALDGMLANACGNKTKLGALLNELCDQISDLALYLPFIVLSTLNPQLLLATLFCALLTEFAGVLACSIGVARRFDGPMGKSDRAVAFGLLAIMHSYQVTPLWLNSLLALVLLLSMLTIINRLRGALATSRPATQ
ncbi:CDP-alcohol phosphatidyltransferase family protein [Serratia microhaemolytica]|uniref:CDP-alcohol phosphatidyltransferase family protein n=1 Tax=Serratia microhaemolytica TaxID=2675110 RepID=UPI000FDF1AEB|nr:CDP-alcohol phosphatidyltransferase family protein [Serratia microhaemolytica]